MWKISAVMFALMAAFCLRGVVYVGLSPFWRKYSARVVSNRIVHQRSSVEGTEAVRTVKSAIIRVTYHNSSGQYECELANADSLVAAKPGDLINIRVFPGLPRVACPDARIHPLGRLAAVAVWGGLAWLLLLAARAAWLQ